MVNDHVSHSAVQRHENMLHPTPPLCRLELGGLRIVLGVGIHARVSHPRDSNVKARDTDLHQVVSRAVVIATGVTANGDREVLGLAVGDSEEETFWTEFLRSLRRRGLAGVRLVISDAHEGLKAAARKTLQGAIWQRCRVHFARNVLARVPKGHQDVVAAALRTVFVHPTPVEISAAWDRTADMFARQFPKVKELMDLAKGDVLAFTAFPSDHWRKIWSNNPLERLNKEIKRTHERRADLPQRPGHHPPRRRRARRATRRLGHPPPLPLRSLHGQALPDARQ